MNLRSDLDTIEGLAKLEALIKECLAKSQEVLLAAQTQVEEFKQMLADKDSTGKLLRECRDHLIAASSAEAQAEDLLARALESQASVQVLYSGIRQAADDLGGSEELESLRQEHARVRTSMDELGPMVADTARYISEARAVTEIAAQHTQSVEKRASEVDEVAARIDILTVGISDSVRDCREILAEISAAREHVVSSIREFPRPEELHAIVSEQSVARKMLLEHQALLSEHQTKWEAFDKAAAKSLLAKLFARRN